MKFLNIWIGGEIPLNRKRCIRSFIGKMKSGDDYLLLSENDFLSEIAEEKNNFWKLYTSRYIQFQTDYLRLRLACKTPDLFYSDTDVLFSNNDLKFDKPGAYIGQWGAGAEPFLFYVNNDCQFFIDMIEFIETLNPATCFLPIHLQRFFKKNKGRFNLISQDLFSHQRLGKY